MHVVQVDPPRPETAEAGLALRAAVRGRGIYLDAARGRVRLEAELGGEEDGSALGGVGCEPFAEEVFGVAVGGGGVSEGEAEGVGAREKG